MLGFAGGRVGLDFSTWDGGENKMHEHIHTSTNFTLSHYIVMWKDEGNESGNG
jgi:hypothetical protein